MSERETRLAEIRKDYYTTDTPESDIDFLLAELDKLQSQNAALAQELKILNENRGKFGSFEDEKRVNTLLEGMRPDVE